MKKIIKRIFNIPTITTTHTNAIELADLLNEPLPTGADVLAWYNKNIPANEF